MDDINDMRDESEGNERRIRNRERREPKREDEREREKRRERLTCV